MSYVLAGAAERISTAAKIEQKKVIFKDDFLKYMTVFENRYIKCSSSFLKTFHYKLRIFDRIIEKPAQKTGVALAGGFGFA